MDSPLRSSATNLARLVLFALNARANCSSVSPTFCADDVKDDNAIAEAPEGYGGWVGFEICELKNGEFG